jgi:hypothetical protein
MYSMGKSTVFLAQVCVYQGVWRGDLGILSPRMPSIEWIGLVKRKTLIGGYRCYKKQLWKEKKMVDSKKWCLIFTASFIFILDTASYGLAQDDEDTRPTLRGFPGVYVVVEPLSPQIERDGLTTDQVQKDTELKLRTAGMKVLSKEEFQQTLGKPYLYVNVNISILRTQITRYIFYIRLEFNQEVSLVNSPMTVVPAATWSTGGWGIDFSLENIRDILRNQVEKFANAYLAVNPK